MSGLNLRDRVHSLALNLAPPYQSPSLALNLSGTYSKPVGTVHLNIGGEEFPTRSVVFSATTAPPTGHVQAFKFRQATITTLSAAPMIAATAIYDVNLLPAMLALDSSAWIAAAVAEGSMPTTWRESAIATVGNALPVTVATNATASTTDSWQSPSAEPVTTESRWQSARQTSQAQPSRYQLAPSLASANQPRWQPGLPSPHSTASRFFVQLPLRVFPLPVAWHDGRSLSQHHRDTENDGDLLVEYNIVVWNDSGLAYNAKKPPPPPPPPKPPPPWGTDLTLICPRPSVHLNLGRTPCILVAERQVPKRRTYMSVNSASLVRWPDLVPLPVTSMTIETDFDSWCWALSATLAGTTAWGLVQPNPLACEVLATINGQQWTFLLDVPNTQRSFNSDRVTLKGRSRSAWLQAPFAAQRSFTQDVAREMVQLAEAALDNTGWGIEWNGENWVVPAGRYSCFNTPIGALIQLVQATDDGLYTDPIAQTLYAQKRWPVASWLLDGETIDLLIPEDAVMSLSQSPLYTPPLNGVYVSGTTHGVMAFVKIAGTDGALQPAEPIVNDLLCDVNGVAARQRGLNALSESGAGWTMDAEVLFTPEVGLIRPGLIVSIAGIKGITRSCRLSANWSGGLQVRQAVGIERREIEG